VIRREGSLATLAGSRTFRSRLPCLEAHCHVPRVSRAPPSLLATISQSAQLSPLDPAVWRRVLDEAQVPGRETIIHAIEHGVPLSLEDIPYPGVREPNHPLLYLDFNRVKETVAKEERLGRYIKLPPNTDLSSLNLSSMGVAPRFSSFEARRAFETHIHQLRPRLKHAAIDDFNGGPVSAGPGLAALDGLDGEVKLRLIHDLTHPEGQNINAFVESPYFELPTAVRFARRLTRGSYMWKGDIDSAFRIVPVRPRDWPLLAFFIDGTLYVDTRLPFGHGLSPYYFCNFVGRPLLYVAVRRGASLLGALASYVDDFFGGCDDYDSALDQMQLWLSACADLGVPVSKAKTFLPTRVLEILGYLIDTENMTISVSRERIQDILDEMKHIEGKKSVRKRDLERLAGKMTFVCSVMPGGRTFMRELLDTLKALRGKKHWAHLSNGFRADMSWWQRFAHSWNGAEAIPPPITVPCHFLSSDASGDRGLGVFFFGAGLHIPLPLNLLDQSDGDEHDLIVAETELVAAVLLVALAAPLLPGEHLMIGIDNTVALSWIDRGTAKRPRAMHALRFLWRVQACYRLHVSTRYIPSERNQLADSASRLDPARFHAVAAHWRDSHSPSLRAYSFRTNATHSYLHTAAYGPTGGAAGHLVKLLVEGHASGVWDAEGQMDGVLHQISALSSRLVAQQPDRLHHVPCDDWEDGQSTCLLYDQGLSGLLGTSHVIHGAYGAESREPSRSSALPAGYRTETGQEGGEGRAVPARSSEDTDSLGVAEPTRPHRTDSGHGGSVCVLGLSPSGQSGTQNARQASTTGVPGRCPLTRQCCNPGGARLEDHSVCGADSPRGTASSGGPALVPTSSIQPVDLAFATPVIPDAIVRAVFDDRKDAVAFQVHATGEFAHPPIASPDRPLVPSRLCQDGVHPRRAHLADHAPWRLENAGGRHVVRRGFSHAQPARGAPSHGALTAEVGPGPPQ
jgi:hypothetical protein